MTTIVPSPRERAGLPPPARYGRRVGDWIAFQLGDLVVDVADERHVGEVLAIKSSVHVTVRWRDSGWRSVINAKQLRKSVP